MDYQITSSEQFKALVLEKLAGPSDQFGDFIEWATDESEQWLSFNEWEQFCMDNGMA